MKSRCYNVKDKRYSSYWWRWITVCPMWLWVEWFSNFLSDMWERPVWYSIDRIDNDWNYEPSNCRRANIHEQCSNRRSSNKIVWVCYDKFTGKRKARLEKEWKVLLNKRFTTMGEAIDARKHAESIYL